uniref:Sulfotransferase n=1 Tax=Branchiostoma floridae TaxID=7739 RepID=C3YAY3_BRAFL|eukprot:XP_002606574.1 hypothetical protein BRAFLDRAFT_108184 [Branchiostoma floridae]
MLGSLHIEHRLCTLQILRYCGVLIVRSMPRLSQPKFAMDKKKMLLLQSVAVLLVIVAFMLLVYEYPIGRQQQVGEQTEGQAQAQAQGTGVQMQRLELKWIKDSGAAFDDLPWADGGYNVIVHGMTYKWKVHDVMPSDTSYFSILRNPENHFKSMFHYYDVGKVLGITGKNQASKILKNPSALTDKKGGIENFRNITRDFGMMVILEYLSESLVLLRRVMCWELRDILYLDKAVTTYSYKDIPMGSRQLSNLKMINKIDFQLYDFFNQTLWKTIKGLGPEFLEEVKYYREVNIEVAEYCRQIETEETIAKLSIPAGQWTPGFMVHQRTCEELKLQFEDWNTKFIMRRNAEIRGESENDVTDTEGTEGDLPPPPKVDHLPPPPIPKEKEDNLPPPPKVDTRTTPPLPEEKVDNLPSPPLKEGKGKGKKTDKKSQNSAKDILNEMNVPDELPSAPK